MAGLATPVGEMIRGWRVKRRMSQLHLAAEADISQRHLSFVESGRSVPSREMVLHLADRLDVPLRARNHLLLAAGFAPNFVERRLDDPSLAPAMEAVQRVLDGHAPNPAIAVDRHWNMIASNGAIGPFLENIGDPALLAPPVNVLRLSLHPKGLAPRIVNLHEWRAHLLHRLRRQNDSAGDPILLELERELASYPGARRTAPHASSEMPIAVPLQIRMDDRILSFISTITVFGSPLDVTLSELAVESFFPADRETAEALKAMAK